MVLRRYVTAVRLPTVGARRLGWMDTARGAAVFLVIFEHALMLTPKALPPVLIDLSNVFAPFRIPTLMFLSGLLLARSLDKPFPRYAWGKVSRILWPYLLWSVLIWGLANWGDDRPNLLRELFVNPTTTPMWFLGYLVVYYVIAVLVRGRAAVVAVPLLLVAAGVVEPENAQRFFYLLAFFLTGSVVSLHADRLLPLLFRPAVTVPSAVVGLALAVASALGANIKYEALYALPVFASIVAALPALEKLSGTRPGQALARYGRHTIIFYVVHWPTMVVAWNVLAKLGVDSALVLAAGNIVAGVLAGLVALWAVRRWPLVGYLFSLSPARPAREAS